MLLLHPRITLSAAIVGLASTAALCGSVAVALSPLATVPGLQFISHDILAIVTVCGAVSAVCTALAAIGRSFVSFVDNNGAPPNPGQPAELPKAA